MVEVKNFHFLKRPFLTKKGKWFFVPLRGGRGGVRASVTFVTKKWFFFEGFPNGFNSPDLIILLSRYLKHYCSRDAGCGALHGIRTGLRSAECSVTRNIMSRNTNKQLSGVRGDYKV